MGKPKKGKKTNKDDEFEEDIEVDLLKTEGNVQADTKPAGGKKMKKGRKKKDDDWDDGDVAAEIAAMSLQKGDDSEDDDKDVTHGGKAKKKKDKKKDNLDEDSEDDQPNMKPAIKGVSAFMMLDMDDESNEDMSSEDEESKPVKTINKKTKVKEESVEKDKDIEEVEEKQPQPNKKNKKKGAKKEKQVEEEDFDAVLAEFGAPQQEQKTETTGKKKKGKKGKIASVEEPMEEEAAEETGLDLTKDISQMTEEELAKSMGIEDDEDDRKKRNKKKQKPKEEKSLEETESVQKEDDNEEDEEEDGGTVKTAAQKKKEKRERQKQKKLEEASKKKKGAKESTPDTQEGTSTGESAIQEKSSTEAEEAGEVKEENKEAATGEGKEEEEGSKAKKKDRKKKKGKEVEEEKKKKPSKLALAMQERLKQMKEEEERLIREEEEKERIREELIRQKEEKIRLEREKKDREKQKKKEKIEKLKAEGKYMTAKQKEAMKMAQAKLEAMKAAGVEIPSVEKTQDGEKKKRVVYDSRPKKRKQLQTQVPQTEESENKDVTPEPETQITEVEVKVAEPTEKKGPISIEPAEAMEEEPKDVKDDWDVSSEEEDTTEEKLEVEKESVPNKTAAPTTKQISVEDEDEDEGESDDEEDEEDESEEESDSESEEEDTHRAKERARERALTRIQKRKDQADKNKNLDNLRAPVVCVLGHVDTGKTKILDKLRRTNVQDGEAGGITQQIGATNVPEATIREQTKMCKEFLKKELKIPGLLIIDTPGHESFSNLRTRGSSLCDIAILVVDIMHGLEPQTIESINLLKSRKTPFVIALNKIDRLFQWQPNPHGDVMNTIKKQKQNTKLEFEERAQQAVVQFAEQGLNVALFYENKNPREYFSLVPTSAHSGDGMGNLIALVCEMSQSMLAKRLAYSEELQATVMEVKALPGMGTTIDVILVNGSIKEAATIVVAGQEGPIVTQIRGLLLPQPLKELRVKGAYENKKEVFAAQGCKIMAKDLDKALAGLPLYIAYQEDEIEIYKEEIAESLQDILGSIKLSERGVFVQASTLGSLEALLEFLKTSKIPYAGINIGPVHKRDIMKASVMLEHDSQYAVILAFDVKVEREAQEMADSLGVQIFPADIIYHLFDRFMAYRDNLKKQKQEEFKNIAVFPCKIRVLPQYIFNSRDPIVCGVIVESGFIKLGTPLCVPSKEFLYLGRVTSLEINHKTVDKAVKGQEVCIKIENTPGETPKLYGRHFDHTDIVTSKISRQSIDAVKNYFREEMTKLDWQLMVELKNLFTII